MEQFKAICFPSLFLSDTHQGEQGEQNQLLENKRWLRM